ncbi:hypothetical protein SAMN05428985_103653 [Nocardioides sp. YR527]|uniref:hypothetical protein n=1 Tax=Nocardioides sp. YR527 TaxID=1881028 RepID=UPI000889A2A8|nr:hypothetical protein [Nocardioides sp. YR527]SDK33817.1 hypothetical protein SAMN05428985_103653 [Nocardioides sp. YR527]
MSFDLYFFDLEPGQSWDDALKSMEAEALRDDDAPMTDAQLQIWERIKGAVAPVLPDATEHVTEQSRELTDDASAIQVSVFGDELSITVPYWYQGEEAERLVALLREVARRVEEATGRVAYDPQADAAFLGTGDKSAAVAMSKIRRLLLDRWHRSE